MQKRPEGSRQRGARALPLMLATAFAGCTDFGPSLSGPTEWEPAFSSQGYVAAGNAFTDNFVVLDATRWINASTHTIGRGPFSPANVTVSSAGLQLAVKRKGYTGAEVVTTDKFLYGTFEMTAQCDVPRGAICALFLYQPGVGDNADEIDIEIIPDTRRVYFTTWVSGRMAESVSVRVPFDPGSGMHTYAIERQPGSLRFMVDGTTLHEIDSPDALPSAEMPLLLNAWWPNWLKPKPGDGVFTVRQVRVF